MSFAKRFIGAETLPTRLSDFDVQQSFCLSADDIAAVAEREVVLHRAGEGAVALHQAEAARSRVREGRGGGARRVVERAPDALAAARPQGEAVGIVDLRPPVDRAGLRLLRVPVHGGEPRDAEAEIPIEIEISTAEFDVDFKPSSRSRQEVLDDIRKRTIA